MWRVETEGRDKMKEKEVRGKDFTEEEGEEEEEKAV